MTKEELQSYLNHFPKIISKELEDYVVKEVFKSSRYIFTTRKGRQQYGYCTHCEEEYKTHGLKHNEKATCPRCNSDCKVKSSGRGRKKLFDGAYFVYYDKSVIDPNVIVARGIYAERDYSGSYINVETMYRVVTWYIFEHEEGGVMFYEPSWWQRWMSDKSDTIKSKSVYCNFHNWDKSYIKCLGYSRNSIEEAVKDTPFRWSGWEQFNHKDMTEFFDLYAKYPCVEYLTKIGFRGLVEQKLEGYKTYSSVNWRGKSLTKVLKISKQELKEIKQQDTTVTFWLLKLLQLNKKKDWGLSISEIENIAFHFSEYDYENLEELLIYGSMKSITRYIEKQQKKNTKQYYGTTSVLRTWRDYIEDCKKLEMDLTKESIVFPTDLYKAHQDTIKKVKIKANKELDKKIRKRLKTLNKYCYERNGLLIRPAVSTKELIAEGNKLNHCVGGYAEKYADGKTDIFLIRKASEPDKPYFTVEIRKSEVIQVRGKDNHNPNKEVQAFINKYKEEVLDRGKARNKIKAAIPA